MDFIIHGVLYPWVVQKIYIVDQEMSKILPKLVLCIFKESLLHYVYIS